MASTTQFNLRLTPEARRMVKELAKHFTRDFAKMTGRQTSQTEVIERAIRHLHASELSTAKN